VVTGCDNSLPKNKVEQDVEELCRKDGATYQANSLVFCFCDKCNTDHLIRCDTSGRTGIQCYHGDGSTKACDGNCLFAKCSDGKHSKIDTVISNFSHFIKQIFSC
jgi:hypothetical protein